MSYYWYEEVTFNIVQRLSSKRTNYNSTSGLSINFIYSLSKSVYIYTNWYNSSIYLEQFLNKNASDSTLVPSKTIETSFTAGEEPVNVIYIDSTDERPQDDATSKHVNVCQSNSNHYVTNIDLSSDLLMG